MLTDTGSSGQFKNGRIYMSGPGDMYNQRAASQQIYGDPYGQVSNSNEVDLARAGIMRQPGGQYGTNWDAQGFFGPDFANNQRNYDLGANNIGMQGSYLNQQRGFAGDDYQNQLDQLNWQRGNLTNDINSANQNLAYRDQMIGNLQKVFGINDRALANQIAQSMLDQSVNTNILNQNINQNALDTLQKNQAATSRGVAGGGMFFPGVQTGINQTNQAGAMAEDILRNRLRGVTEGGDLTRQGYQIGADKERIGLENSILGQQMSRLGDADSVFKLGRQGEAYNIQEQGLQNSLNQKLASLGYQQGINANELEKLKNSKNAEDRALWLQIAKFGMGG